MRELLIAASIVTVAAADNLVTEPLPDGRFRTTVSYPRTSSPEVIARMMIRLREEAARACADRGPPVIDEPLEVNPAPGHANRLNLTQTFSCGPA